MSKCRRCKQEVDKHTTMFGYCVQCQKDLGGKPEVDTKEKSC